MQACANPLLYGWLNDNFRKEFQKIGETLRRKPSHVPAASGARKHHEGANTPPRSSAMPTAVAVVKTGTADTAVTIVQDSPLHLHNELTAVTHLVPDQTSHLVVREQATGNSHSQEPLQQL